MSATTADCTIVESMKALAAQVKLLEEERDMYKARAEELEAEDEADFETLSEMSRVFNAPSEKKEEAVYRTCDGKRALKVREWIDDYDAAFVRAEAWIKSDSTAKQIAEIITGNQPVMIASGLYVQLSAYREVLERYGFPSCFECSNANTPGGWKLMLLPGPNILK